MPQNATLLMGDTGYEMWVVSQARPGVVEYLTPQLPIKGDLQALHWCKTLTGPDATRWLWGRPDDGISVAVTDDKFGNNPGGSRVAIMTGSDGGSLATECVAS
jgi:hypothetical protein